MNADAPDANVSEFTLKAWFMSGDRFRLPPKVIESADELVGAVPPDQLAPVVHVWPDPPPTQVAVCARPAVPRTPIAARARAGRYRLLTNVPFMLGLTGVLAP